MSPATCLVSAPYCALLLCYVLIGHKWYLLPLQRSFYTGVDSLFACILLTCVFTQLQSTKQLQLTPGIVAIFVGYATVLFHKFAQVTEGEVDISCAPMGPCSTSTSLPAAESVAVIRDVGVQLFTKYRSGKSKSDFIDIARIQVNHRSTNTKNICLPWETQPNCIVCDIVMPLKCRSNGRT